MTLVKMKNLCFTDKTLYAVDEEGLVWYINMKNGEWALHGNPTMDDRARELKRVGEENDSTPEADQAE